MSGRLIVSHEFHPVTDESLGGSTLAASLQKASGQSLMLFSMGLPTMLRLTACLSLENSGRRSSRLSSSRRNERTQRHKAQGIGQVRKFWVRHQLIRGLALVSSVLCA